MKLAPAVLARVAGVSTAKNYLKHRWGERLVERLVERWGVQERCASIGSRFVVYFLSKTNEIDGIIFLGRESMVTGLIGVHMGNLRFDVVVGGTVRWYVSGD